MKRITMLYLLVAVAAAVPARDSSTDTSSVKKILEKALDEKPKKARQLFSGGAYRRTLRKREEEARSEDQAEEAAVEEREKNDELGQEEGWSPVALQRLPAQARSLSSSDSDSAETPGSDSADLSDSDSGDAELEDREAEDSHLSPLYAPAPGGPAGGYGPGYGGYGGYGPYIYIVPIVLPAAGRPPGPAAGHVVTETGHQSHHYRHAQYQPIYGGSYGVPPIYIPKGYGVHHGIHGVHHGVHGKHGGHTTVHHEDKTIVRDIAPPIFKA